MGRKLVNIVLVLFFCRLDYRGTGVALTCYSCSSFEVTDYANASQSDVDASLRFLSLVSSPDCTQNPNATDQQECADGELCIMNDLNITIDYSGSPVQFSLLARECTTETAPQTTCYTQQDAEFDTVTASSQESVTTLGQTISNIIGVSCLCPHNLCNDVDVDVTTTMTTTLPSTTMTTSFSTTDTTSTTTTAKHSAASAPGRTHWTAATVTCLLFYIFL